MNVLYGMLQPDEGEITIDGRPHTSRNPKEAMAAGIGMVHQHFMLVEVFSVAENLILGREQTHRRGAEHAPGPEDASVSCRTATGCRSTPTP